MIDDDLDDTYPPEPCPACGAPAGRFCGSDCPAQAAHEAEDERHE